jgi:hypothetical protein
MSNLHSFLPVTGSDIYFALQVFGIIYAAIAVCYLSYLLWHRLFLPTLSAIVCWNNRRKYHKQFHKQYRSQIRR